MDFAYDQLREAEVALENFRVQTITLPSDGFSGINPGIAVRLTTHPVAAALCTAVGSPLVSTSANISGRPTARNRHVLRRQFRPLVDYIVPGDCGPLSGPSEIRDLETGKVLRPREQ